MDGNNDISKNETRSRRPKQPLILLTILALTLVTATSNGIYAEIYYRDRFFSTLTGAGVILMLILTEWKGRRVLFMTLFILSLISSLLYLCQIEYFELWFRIVCLSLHAPVQGSGIALLYVVICEYCDPKRRFLFLIANSAIEMLFFWIAIVMESNYREEFFGDYLQYMNVILGVFGLWSVFRWPESPYWLASKRRFEESAKAFVEVRGGGSESSEELRVLTDARPRPGSVKMIYAPLLIALPVLCMSVTSFDTVHIYQVFALKNGQKWFEWPTYLLFLILKCISALASVLTVLIPLTLPRKVLFLSCGFFFASDFFITFATEEMKIPIAAFIFEAIIDYGPRTVTIPLLIELVPQKFVSLVTVIITVMYIIMEFYLIDYGLPINGGPIILITVLIIICYFIMPEVREKTLIEIEQLYVTKKDKPQQSIQTDL